MTPQTPPTDRPLTAGDVKLLSKLMDTLKPFAEVAEKLEHCHVVEICEPTPDNPSRNIIPMPREWFERAGDDLEAIVIQLHSGGVLSEGQASKMTGLNRIEVRKLSDAYRLSRPAASEGEDYTSPCGYEAKFIDGQWRVGMAGNLDCIHDAEITVHKHISDEWSETLAKRIAAALASPPVSEREREAIDRLKKGVWTGEKDSTTVNMCDLNDALAVIRRLTAQPQEPV